MKLLLCELLLVWMLGAPRAETLTAQPELAREDEQQVGRRYAESTIASEISKIMDSMLQKNFVDFLLTQREKKSKGRARGSPVQRPAEAQSARQAEDGSDKRKK